ncbi:hypothetical protein OMP40_37050 [Cohnella rhizosphaerae]|uniref:Beta-mannosidase-like galactose-binding domain-containing protein n=1 Tax=Cohnella rhizosphaerae TaxID=1457232 RepID=A0A9X4L127_9BACL|nr:hypothetical protein [Cohnella rhizosphaerae]MDG0814268.1 hypothetical protein [Cohnella rhizosphaerae]
MRRSIALTGAWQLKGEGIDPSGKEATVAIDAQVPGHVHQDLLEAGLIADPGYRKQAEDCQWVEHWRWTYRRTFELERMEPGRPLLEFEGLDTYAEIALNGIPLARTDNMFVRYRFDVSGLLREGTNELVVRFRTVAEGLAGKSYAGLGAAFTNERLFVRRMQCTFGWDWVGRLVSYGIWRPVRLVFEDVAAIEDLFCVYEGLGRARRVSRRRGRYALPRRSAAAAVACDRGPGRFDRMAGRAPVGRRQAGADGGSGGAGALVAGGIRRSGAVQARREAVRQLGTARRAFARVRHPDGSDRAASGPGRKPGGAVDREASRASNDWGCRRRKSGRHGLGGERRSPRQRFPAAGQRRSCFLQGGPTGCLAIRSPRVYRIRIMRICSRWPAMPA